MKRKHSFWCFLHLKTTQIILLFLLGFAGIFLSSACRKEADPILPPETTGDYSINLAQHFSLKSPGGMVMIRDNPLGRPLFITRDKQGELHALDGWCPHQGCSLGAQSGKELECPCHASSFDLDGEVKKGPSPIPLIEYGFTIYGDTMVVHFADRRIRRKGEVTK